MHFFKSLDICLISSYKNIDENEKKMNSIVHIMEIIRNNSYLSCIINVNIY